METGIRVIRSLGKIIGARSQSIESERRECYVYVDVRSEKSNVRTIDW